MESERVAENHTASRPGRDIVLRAVRKGRHALDEAEAKAVLAAYDVPTPLGQVTHSAEEAARAVEKLGRRCVLKGLGPDIQHKSDSGLVELDVRDRQSARLAYHRIVDRGAGRVQSGVLVEEWVSHDRELLVGMRRDAQFGPVVALGLGGIFTEAVADVAFALPPLDADACREMVDELRTKRMLGAIRGLPAVNMERLEHVIQAVAQMAGDNAEISEIDVNPLLVTGSDLVAADALVVLDEQPPTTTAGAGAHASGCDRSARDLRAVFEPRSVVVVGASDDAAKWGGSVMHNLIDGGFEGALYPVNPRGGSIFGLPAFTSLDDLPEIPELAIVALGGAQSIRTVGECGRLGIRAAIVIAAGFAEVGADGVALQDELTMVARNGGVTLVGPNCMGVLCTASRLNAMGFVELRPDVGPLSVISQSGNIGTQFLMSAERQGVGIEKFVSSGNQASTDATDLLAYLAEDPATGVVIMYLEGVEDGRRLYEVASSVTRNKPVILVRGGRSDAGRRAASSHTGALAGSGRIFAAAARQARVITAAEPDEALDVASVLAYLPRPAGRRVAVVSLGGGWGVLTADALEDHDLALVELPQDVLAAVDELLPPFWSRGNPIDLVTTVTGGVPEKVIELVAMCDEVDAVITLALIGSPSSGRTGRDQAPSTDAGADGDLPGATLPFPELNERETELMRHLAGIMERTGKPILSVPLRPVERRVFPGLGRFAPVLLRTPGDAVRALASATWYATHVAFEDTAQPAADSLSTSTSED